MAELKDIIAFGIAVGFILMLLMSRYLEHGLEQQLSEYHFKLPILAPLGFLLLSRLPFTKAWLLREAGIRVKLNQLYGRDRGETFHLIHLAQKITLLVSTTLFLLVIGLAGDGGWVFLLLGGAVLAVIWLEVDRELDKKVQLRKRDILIDWPEFLNVLVLLVGAGLPLQTALERAVKERDAGRPLFLELHRLVIELHNGLPLASQLEQLSRRCRVAEVTRFVAAVLPVIRQGNSNMVGMLTALSQEAWERRKDIARKQGEEAGAKLVLPMAMVFVAIAIIVMAPALISMDF